jgi:hypothetical protein
MATDILLVHSGPLFPSHINDCIALLIKQDFHVHLIIEPELNSFIKNRTAINIVNINDVSDSRYGDYKILNYDTKFREGFFLRTSSRFIIIDNYARLAGLTNFFHIENDIAIFSNLSNIQDYLNKSIYDISIVMDNYFRCVPSIIWYRNCLATNRLANFIYYNNNIDDMKNLARFFHKNRDSVTNFPIVPLDLIDKTYNINYGNMYKEMQSIFDGAAIGQYLYGTDANNADKNTSSGFINETCVIDFSKFHIEPKPVPKLILENFTVPINNLHMHCKNIQQLL